MKLIIKKEDDKKSYATEQWLKIADAQPSQRKGRKDNVLILQNSAETLKNENNEAQ